MKQLTVIALALGLGCGGTQTVVSSDELPPPTPEVTASPAAEVAPIPAPPSGPARDISFPAITRVVLANGLEVNTVTSGNLPAVHMRLVIRSGAETDPAGRAGLSNLVAEMLREGTRQHSSAEIAERIEFLGADLSVGADEENVHLVFRALSDQLDEALDILAELVTEPAFSNDELEKLKRRENDRLALSSRQPRWLARRELNRRLYGANHPYGTVDTDEASLRRIRRADLVRWHRSNMVPNNAFLVVVGAVDADAVQASATRAFTSWSRRTVRARALPELPTRSEREIIIVDRVGSAQSTILISNLAIARSDEDFVPLDVANQVLGGSAASRLFMDLREQRSLTYGAYSDVGERVGVAPFVAMASVRTPVTDQAMSGLFEHLDRIIAEEPTAEEVGHATTYLSDSFPLQIATPARIAWMVANLRIFNLPDSYWETYRSAIRSTTPAQALAAAQEHIRPSEALVVVVGTAAEISESLRAFGPVTVVDPDGSVKQRFPMLTPEEIAAAAQQNADAADAEAEAEAATTETSAQE
ncbi:MAG: zinc protease [Polyangiales bacterium]|jgi:zinc protease